MIPPNDEISKTTNKTKLLQLWLPHPLLSFLSYFIIFWSFWWAHLPLFFVQHMSYQPPSSQLLSNLVGSFRRLCNWSRKKPFWILGCGRIRGGSAQCWQTPPWDWSKCSSPSQCLSGVDSPELRLGRYAMGRACLLFVRSEKCRLRSVPILKHGIDWYSVWLGGCTAKDRIGIFMNFLPKVPLMHAGDTLGTSIHRQGIVFLLCLGDSVRTAAVRQSRFQGEVFEFLKSCRKQASKWAPKKVVSFKSLQHTFTSSLWPSLPTLAKQNIYAVWARTRPSKCCPSPTECF